MSKQTTRSSDVGLESDSTDLSKESLLAGSVSYSAYNAQEPGDFQSITAPKGFREFAFTIIFTLIPKLPEFKQEPKAQKASQENSFIQSVQEALLEVADRVAVYTNILLPDSLTLGAGVAVAFFLSNSVAVLNSGAGIASKIAGTCSEMFAPIAENHK